MFPEESLRLRENGGKRTRQEGSGGSEAHEQFFRLPLSRGQECIMQWEALNFKRSCVCHQLLIKKGLMCYLLQKIMGRLQKQNLRPAVEIAVTILFSVFSYLLLYFPVTSQSIYRYVNKSRFRKKKFSRQHLKEYKSSICYRNILKSLY